jgi:hypothetical protein
VTIVINKSRPVGTTEASCAEPLGISSSIFGDDGRLHWYRVKDFPVALCGHVSPFETLEAAAADSRGQR